MYYPILRGKQFELIALRELSETLHPHNITPVIEPVRKNLKPLISTIETLASRGITPIIIVNPSLGDFAKELLDADALSSISEKFIPCVKIRNSTDPAIQLIKNSNQKAAVFIENGVDKTLISAIEGAPLVFANKDKLVPGALALMKNVVLYRNAFNKQVRNADYDERSFYSTLHVEYKSLPQAIGFGDFTILSEEYSESGGPAYVVTIHLSYIDSEEFNSMYVRHFSSYDDESPTDPGGKFKDALKKLVSYVTNNETSFVKTSGLSGLLLLEGKPFPGLGQVKKLSLKHHIETISSFIQG
jgi:hypothetical protein